MSFLTLEEQNYADKAISWYGPRVLEEGKTVELDPDFFRLDFCHVALMPDVTDDKRVALCVRNNNYQLIGQEHYLGRIRHGHSTQWDENSNITYECKYNHGHLMIGNQCDVQSSFESSTVNSKVCSCSLDTIMDFGCQCGGL